MGASNAIMRAVAIALVAGLGLKPGIGAAQDLVVTASTAASVGPGRMLPSDTPLSLSAGESVTLLGPNGPVDVAGPFDGSVGEAAGLSGTPTASPLADLVNRRDRMKKLGAFRNSDTGAEQQNETMFDLFADGAWCATPGEAPLLYVASRSADRIITLKADTGTVTEILWPAGQSIRAWPAEAPLSAGLTYQAGVGGVALGIITIRPDPSSATLTDRIAGLMAAGCMAQAETAISALSQ
ncbi:MAG: hypothetical protein AAF367_03870 [Pseudomonadota bacterium]